MSTAARRHSTPLRRQALLWGAGALGFGILLWCLRPVLTPFLLGALIAYMLQPGVEWLVRHRIPRSFAALLMIILFAMLAALLVLLVVAVVQAEGPQLTDRIPVLLTTLDAWLQSKLALLGLGQSFHFGNVCDVLVNVEGSERTLFLIVWQYVRTSGDMMTTVIGNFVQYLRRQLLVMGVLAAFYPIALSIAGFQIALPLGILTGLAVLIPYVGFATGLVLAPLGTLLLFGNSHGFVAVAIVYGSGQILETFFLTPRFFGERHPLAVILALLAFGELFGFFGVPLALPVTAILATALSPRPSAYRRRLPAREATITLNGRPSYVAREVASKFTNGHSRSHR